MAKLSNYPKRNRDQIIREREKYPSIHLYIHAFIRHTKADPTQEREEKKEKERERERVDGWVVVGGGESYIYKI